MKPITILIADDHQLILNGIKSMLKSLKKYEIVGEAQNGAQAVQKTLELKPEVVFMDISMPEMSGLEATEKIMSLLPETRILALTQHEENEYVMQILKVGGCGYLLKNSKKEEFEEAIEAVMSGKKYFSKKISEMLINDLMDHKKKEEASDTENPVLLTKREVEIIVKIADDLSNQQIADVLHISLRTVETHRRNIMQKLKVKSVVALIKYAVHHNIVKLD